MRGSPTEAESGMAGGRHASHCRWCGRGADHQLKRWQVRGICRNPRMTPGNAADQAERDPHPERCKKRGVGRQAGDLPGRVRICERQAGRQQ